MQKCLPNVFTPKIDRSHKQYEIEMKKKRIEYTDKLEFAECVLLMEITEVWIACPRVILSKH